MTDSKNIFPPGWRAIDINGRTIGDAVLYFYDAGTLTPRTVYSDAKLTIPLGASVKCNSAGYPCTSGNNKTMVYSGTASLKIKCTSNEIGGTVFEHDNFQGAIDTSSFGGSGDIDSKATYTFTANRDVEASDKGHVLNFNCTSGNLTATLASASSLGNGWWCIIRHGGTANRVTIGGNGVDVFKTRAGSVTSFDLTALGQTACLACDGASFYLYASTSDSVIGATMGWLTETPPDGWLEEDGSEISRTTYAALYAKIGTRYGAGDGSTTFNLRDMRGRFKRVWDHGAGRDPDAGSRIDRGDGTTGDNVGTLQANEYVSHTHGVTDGGHTHSYSRPGGTVMVQAGSGASSICINIDSSNVQTAGTGISINNSGGNETRPKNVYEMSIVRAY